MGETRYFEVWVYNDHHTSKRRGHYNRPLAYTRYSTEGGCRHLVYANSGVEAKREAVRAHLQLCDQADRHCDRCKTTEK